MSEEKNNIENKQQKTDGRKYAIAGVSAFIFNNKGELLLTKQPKWGNKWVAPGGKIHYGESMETALKREVKEEVNLEIENLEFFQYFELKNNPEKSNLHIVINQFTADLDKGEVILNSEGSEYRWRLPKEWLSEKDLSESYKQAIKYYIYEFSINKSFEDKYQRALADYQNLLKQTAKEKAEFAQYANERLICEMIPVYDHLKLALAHKDQENHDSWAEGVKHVIKQFKEVLSGFGAEEIKTNDEKFDHNIMEAVSEEATNDEKRDGRVAKEVRSGYKLNGKVIIPARVVVYKYK